jgi:hypothetical protein
VAGVVVEHSADEEGSIPSATSLQSSKVLPLSGTEGESECKGSFEDGLAEEFGVSSLSEIEANIAREFLISRDQYPLIKGGTLHFPRFFIPKSAVVGDKFVDGPFGVRFSHTEIAQRDKMLATVFSYFTVGELFPMAYFAKRGERTAFDIYWRALLSRCGKFRYKCPVAKLYRFFRFAVDFGKITHWIPSGVNRNYAYQYLMAVYKAIRGDLDFDELVGFEPVMECALPIVSRDVTRSWSSSPGESVDCDLQGKKLTMAGYYCGLAGMETGTSVEEGRKKFFSWKSNAIKSKADHVTSDPASFFSEFDLDARRENRQVLKNILFERVNDLFRKIVIIDAAVAFWKNGDKMRCANQLYLFSGENVGVLELARDIYNSSRGVYGYKEWSPIGALEEEDDEATLQGPSEVFLQSSLWMKFCAVVSALSARELLETMPDFMGKVSKALVFGMMHVVQCTTLADAVVGFCRSFFERCVAFAETWDFSEFLKPGDFTTLLERGGELLKMRMGSTNLAGKYYATIPAVIEDCTAWLTECHPHLNKSRWTPAHQNIWSRVVSYRNALETQYKACKERDREPFAPVLIGPPGSGKTVLAPQLTQFAVLLDPNRPPGEGKEVKNNDMYTIPPDAAHWNGCVDPTVIVMNDAAGDGFVNTGRQGVHTLRQQIVDRAPFMTPQASIENKSLSFIDPDIFYTSSNFMRWEYSVFSKDNSKQLRRLVESYYVAYPQQCYRSFRGCGGSDHGDLLDKDQCITPELAPHMRYYKLIAHHKDGDISFVRGELVCEGVDSFVLHLKKRYLQHLSKLVYHGPQTVKCSMLTPLEVHKGASCMPGCDFKISPPAEPVILEQWEPEEKSEEPPEAVFLQGACCTKAKSPGVVDRLVDSTADRYIARRLNEFRCLFEKRKATLINILKYLVMACGGAAILMSGIITVSMLTAPKPTRVEINDPVSPETTFVGESLGEVASVDDTQAILNPSTLEDPVAVVERYGIEEAKARVLSNPPRWNDPNHTAGFLSRDLASNIVGDVKRIVFNNCVKLTGPWRAGNDSYGYATYLDSTTLLMNEHVRSKFKQIAEVRHHLDDDPKGNHFRLSADLSRYVTLPGTDISLVRTAPFAGARNIWKYLPQSVGLVARAHFLTGATALAYRKLVNFNGMEGITTSEAWLYDVSHVDGDCGKPIVLEVNKGGLFGGIHVSSFSNGKFGALVLNRKFWRTLITNCLGTLLLFSVSRSPTLPCSLSTTLRSFITLIAPV